MKLGPLLETKNLSKYFGGLKAVDSVNFRVNANEVVGIIGPNGSGKTTLVNLISGLYSPTSGRVVYFGEDITSMGAYERVRRGIMRTFQLASVFKDLKVIENVALAYLRFTRTYKSLKERFLGTFLSEEVRDRAFKALEEVGLEKRAYKKCSELAYGEQRKLEIAMSLVLDPKLILIDEPFAGLSEVEIKEILDVLSKYSKSRSMVVIDHKVSKIIDFVDRLCVMNEGKILCEGEPSEVICDARVRAIYWKYG
jgi:branched-chain amino acid transport system ATP-binding protein